MTRLVNDLLELARMDKIKAVKVRKSEISEIILDVIESLLPLAKTKEINLEFKGENNVLQKLILTGFIGWSIT